MKIRRFCRHKKIFAYLETRIGLLESSYSIVETNFAVFRLIIALERAQLALLEPTKCKNDVRTEISWNVFRQELSNFDTILRPVGVIADNLVAIFVNLAALLRHLDVGGRGENAAGAFASSNIESIGGWR